MLPTEYPFSNVAPPPAILQQPPPASVVKCAQKLLGYATVHTVYPNCFFFSVAPSWDNFDKYISKYVACIYQKYSFHAKNFPEEAAMLVVMLSIAASYQTDKLIMGQTYIECAPDHTHVLVLHLLCHMLRHYIVCFQIPNDIEWSDIISNVHAKCPQSINEIKNVDISKLKPKYESITIPTLLYQILYYLYCYDGSTKVMMESYKRSILCNHRWVINYHKFFKIFRNHVLHNKLNKYELYLQKYFQKQYDISYLLMVSMQSIIMKSIKTEEALNVGIDKSRLASNLFRDIVSQRCRLICKFDGGSFTPELQLDFV